MEQQKYMMAVFNTCIQTDFGKGLIRKFEGTHDAQKLFAELELRAKSSTSAIITAAELLSYITTATLGKNTWNGTTTSFVLHWEEQVRLYERYVDVQSRFTTELSALSFKMLSMALLTCGRSSSMLTNWCRPMVLPPLMNSTATSSLMPVLAMMLNGSHAPNALCLPVAPFMPLVLIMAWMTPMALVLIHPLLSSQPIVPA